ncbi:MAG: hypothetical protein K6G69_07345 [Lachnospiraceae bacterium]|nr:hypothetical protein [Lachnospiraceae bacterium]
MKKMSVKKRMISFLMCTILLMALTGCGPRNPNWYLSTVNAFKEGYNTGWKSDQGIDGLYLVDEEKDQSEEFGYLLRDLDGDGINELLIGIMDDSPETKFVHVVIFHSDLGPYSVFNAGDGYYMYLCDANTLRMDSWYGSETKTEYMVFDSKDNSFLIVDGGSKPQKIELTSFN